MIIEGPPYDSNGVNGFWVYCHNVSEVVGRSRVIDNIKIVYDFWLMGASYVSCVDRIHELMRERPRSTHPRV